MPKMKSHSGTKDRIKISKTGKVLRKQAMSNHFLEKKSARRKRTFAGVHLVVGKTAKNLKRKLGV